MVDLAQNPAKEQPATKPRERKRSQPSGKSTRELRGRNAAMSSHWEPPLPMLGLLTPRKQPTNTKATQKRPPKAETDQNRHREFGITGFPKLPGDLQSCVQHDEGNCAESLQKKHWPLIKRVAVGCVKRIAYLTEVRTSRWRPPRSCWRSVLEGGVGATPAHTVYTRYTPR